jgi:hypothetical protein
MKCCIFLAWRPTTRAADELDRANFSIVEARGTRLRRRPCKPSSRLTPTLGAGGLTASLCRIVWDLGSPSETAVSRAAAFSVVLSLQVNGLGLGSETAVAIRQLRIGIKNGGRLDHNTV